MCRSAAAEWGAYGIRVNVRDDYIGFDLTNEQTLSPGYIRTAMTQILSGNGYPAVCSTDYRLQTSSEAQSSSYSAKQAVS
jgi:NAD(P)-dependent dehydrogenase (short-subunit alcohol dehydrogenase family)